MHYKLAIKIERQMSFRTKHKRVFSNILVRRRHVGYIEVHLRTYESVLCLWRRQIIIFRWRLRDRDRWRRSVCGVRLPIRNRQRSRIGKSVVRRRWRADVAFFTFTVQSWRRLKQGEIRFPHFCYYFEVRTSTWWRRNRRCTLSYSGPFRSSYFIFPITPLPFQTVVVVFVDVNDEAVFGNRTVSVITDVTVAIVTVVRRQRGWGGRRCRWWRTRW